MKKKIIFVSIILILNLLIAFVVFGNTNIYFLEISKENSAKFYSRKDDDNLEKTSNIVVATNEKSKAVEHTYSEEWTIDKEATCTESGSKSHHCIEEGCTSKKDETPIPATGHKFINYFSNNDATCFEEGTKTAICNNGCGARDSITDVGTKIAHTYGEWIVIRTATCAVPGELQRTCKIKECGYIDKRPIVIIVHNYSENWTIDKEATCIEAGSKSHHCIEKGCVSKKDETPIPAIGHTFGEWTIDKVATYEEEGHKYRICITCNNGKEEQVIPKLNEEEVQITTTYTIKEKDNKKYLIITGEKTIQGILNNIISSTELSIIDKSGNGIKDNAKVGTGAKITVKQTNEEVYTIVVKGDVSGDGLIKPIDVTTSNSIRLSKVRFTNAELLAADLNENGKVDPVEITMINSYRLGKIKI